jgi:ER lumen protein retaining receptor
MELVLVIFTLGYICHLVGNALLIKKLREKKNIEGLAFETQIIYLIGSVVRCIWVFDTRLTSLFLVWVELLLSVSSNAYIVYLFWKFKDSKFIHVQNPYKFIYLLIASTVLSIFLHPGSKGAYYFSMQMLVAFTMYFEACGLLPQIYILRKLQEIEVTIGHYVFSLALSRIFRLIFWIMMWLEGEAFVYLMVADFLHTVLLADFVYYYIKRRSGEPLLLQ